jgi:uncharacterized protein YkwD
MTRSGKLLGAALLATVAACGGGGGSESVTVVTGATPTPTATASPGPSPTGTPTPSGGVLPAALAALYSVQPDVAGCRAGSLTASAKADVLARLNAIRALHRLPAVTYSEADDAQTAESSLMMVANNQLSHTPGANWLCYTAAGAAGAGSGNLFSSTSSAGFTDDQYLGGWLTEGGSAKLGHRRWMLDPFLGRTSYGRVSTRLADGRISDAATLKVFDFTGGTVTPSGLPGFVAYPFGDYPARYADAGAFLSFSVVGGAGGRTASSGVRFTNARIAVTTGNTGMTVSDVTHDNDGYGLPNNLQWRVAGLQPGVTYTVQITGVTGAPQAEYSYTFRIVS